jgi:mannan endo-1,4-beta-mannosidase
LYKALAQHPVAYALAWRNAGRKSPDEIEFYVPYKGQASEQNFKKFYQLKRVLFEKKALAKRLYE